jgi:hypothetical protein
MSRKEQVNVGPLYYEPSRPLPLLGMIVFAEVGLTVIGVAAVALISLQRGAPLGWRWLLGAVVLGIGLPWLPVGWYMFAGLQHRLRAKQLTFAAYEARGRAAVAQAEALLEQLVVTVEPVQEVRTIPVRHMGRPALLALHHSVAAAPAVRRRWNGQVMEEDLEAFLAGVFERGLSRGAWLGAPLPVAGRCDRELYEALMGILVDAGIVVDRKAGSSGRLTVHSREEARRLLGLAEPG